MRKLPVTALPQPGDSSVGMVAGAGLESVQTDLVPRQHGQIGSRFPARMGRQGADQGQKFGPFSPSGSLTEVAKMLPSHAESNT